MPQRSIQITVEVKELVPEWERFASLVNSRRYLEALRYLASKPVLARMARKLLGDNVIVEIAKAAVLSGASASVVKQLLEKIGVRPPEELDALEMLVKGDIRAAEKVAPEPLRSLIHCVVTLCPPQQMASLARKTLAKYSDIVRRLVIYYIVEYLTSKGYDSRLADIASIIGEKRLAEILREWPRLPLVAAAEAIARLTGGVVSAGHGDIAKIIYYANLARKLADKYSRLIEEANKTNDPRKLADIIAEMYKVAEEIERVGKELVELGIGKKPDAWKPLLATIAKLEALLVEYVAERKISEDEARAIVERVANVIKKRFPRVAAALIIVANPITVADAVCILRKEGIRLPAPPGPTGGGHGAPAVGPSRHVMM